MFFPILISIIIMYKQKVNFYKLHFLFSVTLIPYYCTYLSRQMFAYGFGMLAIYSYINSKKIISLLFVILAMLFHKSAVVILLAILLFEFITSKKKIIILALVSILSLPFLPIIISLTFTIFNINKWQINNNMIFTIAILKSIPYLIIFYLGLKNYNVLKKDNNLNIYLIMTFLSGFFWITTSLGTWYYRLNIYFLFGVIMLMFNELKLIKGKKDYLILLVSIYLIFFITLREIYLMSLY